MPSPNDPAAAEAAILDALAAAAPRSIAPEEAARRLAPPGTGWHPFLPAVRDAARRLARAGRIAILRKGRPVDPESFKGVIRLSLPPAAKDLSA